MQTLSLGKIGENIAANYLQKKSYKILAKNFQCRKGEIDLITFETSTRTIVFVEVKTRGNNSFGAPQESISKQKIHKIILTIHQFFFQNPHLTKYHWRIDAIGLKLNPQLKIETLSHFKSLSQ